MIRFLFAFLLLANVAWANNCQIPPDITPPRPTPIKQEEVNTTAKVDGFVLSVSWSPDFCANNPNKRPQCGGDQQFNWVLHGLWPQDSAASNPLKDNPRFCKENQAISLDLARKNFCLSPDPQLMQNEWAKHGTCYFKTPEDYFAKAAEMFWVLNLPELADFEADLEAKILKDNPALVDLKVMAKKDFLQEIHICYDIDFKPTSCSNSGRAHLGPVKVKNYSKKN